MNNIFHKKTNWNLYLERLYKSNSILYFKLFSTIFWNLLFQNFFRHSLAKTSLLKYFKIFISSTPLDYSTKNVKSLLKTNVQCSSRKKPFELHGWKKFDLLGKSISEIYLYKTGGSIEHLAPEIYSIVSKNRNFRAGRANPIAPTVIVVIPCVYLCMMMRLSRRSAFTPCYDDQSAVLL